MNRQMAIRTPAIPCPSVSRILVEMPVKRTEGVSTRILGQRKEAQLTLKIAMITDAMAETTAFRPPAMAEIMLPMIGGYAGGDLDIVSCE